MSSSWIFAFLFIASEIYAQSNSKNGCVEANGEEWCESLNQCVLTGYEVQGDKATDDLDENGCYEFEQTCKSLNNECVVTEWFSIDENGKIAESGLPRLLIIHIYL